MNEHGLRQKITTSGEAFMEITYVQLSNLIGNSHGTIIKKNIYLYNARRCDPSLIGTRTCFGMGGPVFVDQKWSRVHFWHAKSGLVGPLFAGTTFGMTGLYRL